MNHSDSYRARILEAARELFLQEGLGAVSMHAIAKKAGIGQGSLYRRYRDKGEICSELLRDSSERFLTELEQSLQKPPFDGIRHLETLNRHIRGVAGFIEMHAELLLMMKSEFIGGKKQLTQFEHPFFLRLRGVFLADLARALEAGECIPLDPEFTATALVSALGPDLYLYQQRAYGSGKEQIADGIATLFVTGLSVR